MIYYKLLKSGELRIIENKPKKGNWLSSEEIKGEIEYVYLLKSSKGEEKKLITYTGYDRSVIKPKVIKAMLKRCE